MCKQCSNCCRLILIRISEKVNDDYKRWAGYHGIEIIEIEGHNFAKIATPCDKLVNNRCSIQETKTELCKAFDCEQEGFKPFKKLL